MTVPRDFWLGTTEVTQGQWHEIFPRRSPQRARQASRLRGFSTSPATPTSSSDTSSEPCYLIEGYRLFRPDGPLRGLSSAHRGGVGVRRRAGEDHLYSGGPDIAEVGWYGSPGLMSAMDPEAPPGNAEDSSHPVGLLKPNACGLYDMSGNLAEWAWRLEDEEDQLVPADTREQILRGGHWASYSRAARVHTRWGEDIHAKGNTTGFRLARTAPEPRERYAALAGPPGAGGLSPPQSISVIQGQQQRGEIVSGGCRPQS